MSDLKILDPSRRAYVHTLTVAVVGALATWGVVGDTLVPLIPAAVVAFFDLVVVAWNHRETGDFLGKVSAAIYAVAGALQPIGLALAFGTDAQWAAGLAVLSALLGGGLAAARAPQPVESA